MVDFKKLKDKAIKVAKAVVLTATVAMSNTPAHSKTSKEDKLPDKDKIENFANTPSAELKISEAISYATDKNGSLHYVTEENVIDVDNIKTPRQETKKYKQEQTEAFENAPNDTTVVVSMQEFTENRVGGFYSQDDKNITIYNVDSSKESVKEDINKQTAKLNLTEAQINSDFASSIEIHEKQHKTNDKDNIYAPGLNPEQQGKLNCHDEITANIAQLVAMNDEYQKKLATGTPQEEALKVFSIMGDRFSFYQNALKEGIDPNSDEAKKLMVQGTMKMWKEKYQERYSEQINMYMENTSSIAGTLIGNEAEYKKRVEKIYDNIDENPLLKEKGIKIGNLSKYLPKEDIELSPQQIQLANDITIKKTGFSAKEGSLISKLLPGKQKKDQKNFVKRVVKNPKALIRLIRKLRGIEVSEKTKKENSGIQNTNSNFAYMVKNHNNRR